MHHELVELGLPIRAESVEDAWKYALAAGGRMAIDRSLIGAGGHITHIPQRPREVTLRQANELHNDWCSATCGSDLEVCFAMAGWRFLIFSFGTSTRSGGAWWCAGREGGLLASA